LNSLNAKTKKLLAITRDVSPAIEHCELTHLVREPIDLNQARQQHHEYEQCLKEAGCRLIRLPAEPELPDSVFVEDTAIVLDELAVIARPGAESRRAETASVADALKPYRRLFSIESPGTLDGGDVMRIGKSLYVGASQRSNSAGIEQLRRIVAPYGYNVITVELHDCLHLKSGVTRVAEGAVLINRRWVDCSAFDCVRLIDVDASEPFAANALHVADAVIYPQAFLRTRERLESQGINVLVVDASELAKAEGGVTCCSLVFDI
jgi:dimethylargininase